MPYNPTSWTAGVTPASQPNMNNLELQYGEATKSLFLDAALEGFVASGLTVTKTASNQITMAAGTGWVVQTDGTLRRYALSSTPQTTSVINTTYFLDLKPDGTLNWATTHSGVNYLTLASVTTDGSGNVNVITDTRPTLWRLFGAASALSLQLPGLVTATIGGALGAPSTTGMSASAVAGAGMGTGTYKYVVTYAMDGGETLQSASVSVTTTGGNNQVSLTGIPVSPDPRVTRRKIYRTAVGGSSYTWVKTIGDNSTTTYTDAASDAAIASSVKVPPVRSTLGGNLRSGYPWSTSTPNSAFAGTVTGVTFGQTTMVTGDGTTGALFNGTTDKISLPTGGLPSGNQPWTILVVTKPTNATNASDAVICSFGATVAGQMAFIAQKAAGGWFAGTFSGDTAAAGTSVAGTKHLLAGTWDGTTLTCNVDAGGATATATPGIRNLTPSAAMLGARSDSSLFYPGTMQKAVIFPYVLNAQQLALYNTLMGGASGNLTFDQQVLDDGALRYYSLNDAVSATTAAETTRYETSLATDGTVSPTNLVVKGVGGQQAAGSFGVPAIVAQTVNQAVTSTASQTILAFAPSATGLYRATCTFTYTNGTPQKPAVQVFWTDPNLNVGASAAFEALNGTAGQFLTGSQANAMGNNQAVACAPLTFYAKTGVAIQITFLDGGGTPSDFVSAMVERLA